MKKYILVLFTAGCMFSGIAGEHTFREPGLQSSPHPRILLPEAGLKQMQKDIASDEVWRVLHERTLSACTQLLESSPLQRVVEGRRMLNTSREALYRLFMLSYAYRTTGDRVYSARAEKELLAVSRFSDWNPSHFLDVAEMTTAVSIGYDWLWSALSVPTRKAVKRAILEKGLLPSLKTEYNSFLTRDNNWNQVCNTAMAFGAAAIMENEPELARKIISRSVEGIRKPMARYGPDGAYPEGYGYWHYGTTYNVLLLALLDNLYGHDSGLSEIPGFKQSAYYITHMVGPGGQAFNFGDSGAGDRLNIPIFWFAQKLGDESLAKSGISQLLERKDFGYEQYTRVLPLAFIFGHRFKMDSKKGKTLPRMFVARNEAPVCLMRTAWGQKDAIFAAIKGGSPSDNTHTHLDEGTFVMEASGVRWALDLGPQDYGEIEKLGISLWDNSQESGRWSIFRYNNFSHNVISVNDRYFNVSGNARIKNWSETPEEMKVSLDLSPMYGGLLSCAERTLSITGQKVVVLTDSICSSDSVANLSWRMLTKAKAEVIKGGILLFQEGKWLLVRLPPQVSPFIIPAKGLQKYDAPNDGISIIGYTCSLMPHKQRSLTVTLIPINNKEDALTY